MKGGLLLCLVGAMCASCAALRPVSLGPETWTVEAKMIPGLHLGMMAVLPERDFPVMVLEGDLVLPEQTFMTVVYRTRTYASAVQVRNQLLATGLSWSVRLTASKDGPGQAGDHR